MGVGASSVRDPTLTGTARPRTESRDPAKQNSASRRHYRWPGDRLARLVPLDGTNRAQSAAALSPRFARRTVLKKYSSSRGEVQTRLTNLDLVIRLILNTCRMTGQRPHFVAVLAASPALVSRI